MKIKHLLSSKYIILGIAIAISLLIWNWNYPLWATIDWDQYVHLTLGRQIIEFRNVSLLPSHISDSFIINAYIPTYAVLLYIVTWLLNQFISLTTALHALDISYYVITVLLSWHIGNQLKRPWIAVISALFGAFIFESLVAQTAFFLLPQGIASILSVISLVKHANGKRKHAIYLQLLALAFHGIIGLFGIGLHIGLHFGNKFLRDIQKFNYSASSIAIRSTVIVMPILVAIVIRSLFSFDIFATQESQALTLTNSILTENVLQWYSYLILFLPIGFLAVIKNSSELHLKYALITSLCIAAILLPMPYTLKFVTVARYFIHVIIAVGVYELVKHFSSSFVKYSLVSLLIGALSIIFYFNQFTFKEALVNNNEYTTVARYEIDAINFLNNNYSNDDVLLVSDPGTQNVFEGLTGINTQGGPFSTKETRVSMNNLYPYNPEKPVKDSLFTVMDSIESDVKTRLLVVNGRFITWQNLEEESKFSTSYNIWAPRRANSELQEYVELIVTLEDATVIYQTDQIVILEFTLD